MAQNKQQKKEYAAKLLKQLKTMYDPPKSFLNHSNIWELLVGVVLSAQSTDVRVNIVTQELFKKYKTIEDYAHADPKEFEKDIYSTGFYRNKAKNIIATAKIILEKYKGQVPNTMEELITLPGVARKTANVVLSQGFGINEGIAVDTHVIRLTQKLGLTKHKDPKKIEKDLMELYPRKEWNLISKYLIIHGRSKCFAKKHNHEECLPKEFYRAEK